LSWAPLLLLPSNAEQTYAYIKQVCSFAVCIVLDNYTVISNVKAETGVTDLGSAHRHGHQPYVEFGVLFLCFQYSLVARLILYIQYALPRTTLPDVCIVPGSGLGLKDMYIAAHCFIPKLKDGLQAMLHAVVIP